MAGPFDDPAGLVNINKSTGAKTLLATDAGQTFTNKGETGAQKVFTLPAAREGLTYTFMVVETAGLRVVATNGATLQLGNSTSAVNGRYDSFTKGSVVVWRAISATEWYALSLAGTGAVT